MTEQAARSEFAVLNFIFPFASTRVPLRPSFDASRTRMDGVDSRSQVGESLSTGVGLSSVYVASEAKVKKSVSIMDVSDGGLTPMKFQYDDGGRAAAGFKGSTGDCVCRAICIASGRTYAEVYRALADGMGDERKSQGRTARNGIHTRRKWFKDYMRGLGFVWVPTMRIGQGCKTHLHDGELPMGKLVVAVSKHYTAVVDGVVHDTHDPQREIAMFEPDHGQVLTANQGRNQNGVYTIQRRCVYGYYRAVTR